MDEMRNAGEARLEDSVIENIAPDATCFRIEIDGPPIGSHFGIAVNLWQKTIEDRYFKSAIEKLVDKMGSDESRSPSYQRMTPRHGLTPPFPTPSSCLPHAACVAFWIWGT
jgi:hypothetical protein